MSLFHSAGFWCFMGPLLGLGVVLPLLRWRIDKEIERQIERERWIDHIRRREK